MTHAFLPPSDFLRAIVNDEVTLTGNEELENRWLALPAWSCPAPPYHVTQRGDG